MLFIKCPPISHASHDERPNENFQCNLGLCTSVRARSLSVIVRHRFNTSHPPVLYLLMRYPWRTWLGDRLFPALNHQLDSWPFFAGNLPGRFHFANQAQTKMCARLYPRLCWFRMLSRDWCLPHFTQKSSGGLFFANETVVGQTGRAQSIVIQLLIDALGISGASISTVPLLVVTATINWYYSSPAIRTF